jgi:hypothetical protein
VINTNKLITQAQDIFSIIPEGEPKEEDTIDNVQVLRTKIPAGNR